MREQTTVEMGVGVREWVRERWDKIVIWSPVPTRAHHSRIPHVGRDPSKPRHHLPLSRTDVARERRRYRIKRRRKHPRTGSILGATSRPSSPRPPRTKQVSSICELNQDTQSGSRVPAVQFRMQSTPLTHALLKKSPPPSDQPPPLLLL